MLLQTRVRHAAGPISSWAARPVRREQRVESAIEFVVQTLVTLGIAAATFRLLQQKMKVSSYSASVAGLFLVAIIWAIDFGSASRIVLLGIEIDRRIELAEDAIHRLTQIEGAAEETQRQLAEMEKRARSTGAEIQHIILREEIRNWLLIHPDGMKTDHAMGMLIGSNNSLESRLFSVSGEDYSEGVWTWPCDATSVVSYATLSERYPLLVYAPIARAKCLREAGDSQWDSDADRIDSLLRVLSSATPRVPAIDQFAEVFSSLRGPDSGKQ